MKEFMNLDRTEQEIITELFAAWLSRYTHEVICKVMERADEIINNEFAMKMLVELKDRQETEAKDFNSSIANLFNDYETFKEFDAHNHPLTHSKSYRDILYDMYIK